MKNHREDSSSSLNNQHGEIPAEVRQYLEQHKIEPILTKAFNQVMRDLPIDPFSEICSILKSESKDIYSINSITIKEKVIEDFKTIPTFEVSMTYKGATRTVLTYPIPFSSLAYEKYLAANEELSNAFNTIFNENVKNLDFEDPKQFDEKLLSLIQNKNKGEDKEKEKENDSSPMSLSICNTLSLMIYISTALMKNMSLSEYIKENKSNLIFKNGSKKKGTPNLGFCIFKTGKNMNSKIKFERFLIMVNNELFNNNEVDKKKIIIDLYTKMYDIIKKSLTAGKAGENGMKTNNEGSFTPPSDKYEDVLKLMEGFIKDINTAMDNKNVVSLGIDFNADNYFNPKENSYDTEGAKKPLDNIQLVDMYVKLIADHPSLTYLEQPMAYDDEDGWSLLIEQLKEKPNINIVKKVDIYRKEPEPKIAVTDPNELVKEKKEEKEIKKEESKEKVDKKKPSKKKKKNLEAIKNDEPQIKTEENLKKEKPKISLYSYRLREANVISDMFNNILKIKENNKTVGGVIYENDIESNQAGIINLGMALNFDYIILNGVNMSDQKITKIKGYVEELEILSNRKEEGDINEKENEEKKENKNENVQDKIKEDVINEEVASKKNSKIDVNKN
jgi:hypothetical protein